MKNLHSAQVERILRESSHNYIHNYFYSNEIYGDDGEPLGTFSQKVLENLMSKGIVRKYADSREYWSEGYYGLVDMKTLY